METEEIRTTLDEARSACAEAESPGQTDKANAEVLARKLAATMSKLVDATESLLAEREAFTGRLRRSSAIRPAGHLEPAAAVSATSSPDEAVTPSPVQGGSL